MFFKYAQVNWCLKAHYEMQQCQEKMKKTKKTKMLNRKRWIKNVEMKMLNQKLLKRKCWIENVESKTLEHESPFIKSYFVATDGKCKLILFLCLVIQTWTLIVGKMCKKLILLCKKDNPLSLSKSNSRNLIKFLTFLFTIRNV